MRFSVQILKARRTYMQSWRLLLPVRGYWRLWWNDTEGASITTAAGATPLTPDQIVLLAPRTDFETSLVHPVRHLHVHFQLDAPFDYAAPGAYTVPVTEQLSENLKVARAALRRKERQRILALTGLVSNACLALPDTLWQEPPGVADPRMNGVVEAMRQQLRKPLANAHLAALANMAPTAFVRRFSQVCGISPQAYYLQIRLEQARHLLEHDDCSIDEVAEACGFCDRNYFSTTFKKRLGVAPATFRRNCHLQHVDGARNKKPRTSQKAAT